MRFIKMPDGVYLNTAQIVTLYAKSASRQYYVGASVAEYHTVLCEGFPDAEAAQRYLRRLILALTTTEKKVIEVKNYEAD